MESIGARIAEAREAKGWTQQRLANELGVTREEVTRWEKPKTRGGRNPKPATLARIGELLDRTAGELISGTSPAKGHEQAYRRGYQEAARRMRELAAHMETNPPSEEQREAMDARSLESEQDPGPSNGDGVNEAQEPPEEPHRPPNVRGRGKNNRPLK